MSNEADTLMYSHSSDGLPFSVSNRSKASSIRSLELVWIILVRFVLSSDGSR